MHAPPPEPGPEEAEEAEEADGPDEADGLAEAGELEATEAPDASDELGEAAPLELATAEDADVADSPPAADPALVEAPEWPLHPASPRQPTNTSAAHADRFSPLATGSPFE